MSGWRIRVDTGGTFTDAWACDPGGREHRCKVLSSGHLRLGVIDGDGDWLRVRAPWPVAPGFFAGWEAGGGRIVVESDGDRLRVPGWDGGEVLELSTGEEAPVVAARLLTGTPAGRPLPDCDLRVATTRGTNALLERKGARTCLFVSSGFEDLPEIRDQRREHLFQRRQPPSRHLAGRVVGVDGRIAADGTRIVELDPAAVRERAREAVAAGFEVAVVALLHSWLDDRDERRVAEILAEEGFGHVVRSAGVAPLIRILPRMETSLVEGFLTPVMRGFVGRVSSALDGVEPRLMTSAGGLVPAGRYHPKDSLLSGPAGGLAGAADLATRAGFDRVLSFDMGGTSTDVARIEGEFSYRHEQQIGPARVVAPALKIETVAAGGGSICHWSAGRLQVGPESAGADPGPACYGRGGPLTLTDVNLLLGLMDPGKAGIPLDPDASERALAKLVAAMVAEGQAAPERTALLRGLRAMAIETMAEAVRSVSVRDGVDPSGCALLAFGGAGPQHACELAARLGIDSVLVPGDAGLLSAWGLERSVLQEHRVRQLVAPLDKVIETLERHWREMATEACEALGCRSHRVRWLAGLRLLGQDSTIDLEWPTPAVGMAEIESSFGGEYRRIYGYPRSAGTRIEVVELRVVAEEIRVDGAAESFEAGVSPGPALFQDAFSTTVVPAGWGVRHGSAGSLLIERAGKDGGKAGAVPEAVSLGLFRSRFEGLVTAMGELLRRTALSTNVKERLDFSCALLDPEGRLVVSAPHVPVHLGALGACVRETLAVLEIGPDDLVVTNHPGRGGSHLPDVTVIGGVFDHDGRCLGYVANRAHHAEIGGTAPGSMPAGAASLEEEGVVIAPRHLVRNGVHLGDEVGALLAGARFPSRRPGDNLADLDAQAAACRFAIDGLAELAREHGPDEVRSRMDGIVHQAARLMEERLAGHWTAEGSTELDGGGRIQVAMVAGDGRLRVDFGGSAPVHPGNLNATPAIVRSVLLYVLRLWLDEDVALNEGLLEPVELVLPEGMLNPSFPADAAACPAVVGGNVETSQRIADLLCGVLGLCADGPGTMNNLLFGDGDFGYYETLGSGAGAGPGFDGASCRQVHMTNTAMTDPEILEHRYPVRVWRHARRRGSGGRGRFKGGDGIVRELEFLRPLTVSLLTQRREDAPHGREQGGDGLAGCQTRVLPDGSRVRLPWTSTYDATAGERVVVETPGGGGWGATGEELPADPPTGALVD